MTDETFRPMKALTMSPLTIDIMAFSSAYCQFCWQIREDVRKTCHSACKIFIMLKKSQNWSGFCGLNRQFLIGQEQLLDQLR
jgi:hypothetical protein